MKSVLLHLLCCQSDFIIRIVTGCRYPLLPLINEADPNSFPSGHTCAAFAAAMIFWRALPSQWLGVRCLLVVMAVCMGLSRLYVGVHYPSDVLAGALVGSLCAWTVWYFWQMYQLRHSM